MENMRYVATSVARITVFFMTGSMTDERPSQSNEGDVPPNLLGSAVD
jgi:hypothetical protein